MLFEFLKKLFCKADEGNRKRKANDPILQNSNSKRHCCNRLKYETTCEHSDKFKMDNVKSSDLLSSKDCNFFYDKKFTANETNLSLKKVEPLTHSTLYQTYRLAEKQQYSELILNFVPSKVETMETILKKKSQELVTKLLNSNTNISSNIESNLRYSKNVAEPKYIKSSRSSFSQNPLTMYTMKQQQCPKNSYERCKSDQVFVNSIDRTSIEVIKTNTLRDKFSNSKVFKQDFVSQITKKYNDYIKQCEKQVQGLSKVTQTLAKQNQLMRELAIEDRLNQTMRLCEIILDEPQTVEEFQMPKISSQMMDSITNALSRGSSNEVLVEKFGLRITRKDIQTLSGLNWLNDEIINFYMNLLITRGENKDYPSVFAMNTFFYPKLVSGGHVSLKRWTRKIDIFTKDILVIPIHLGIHWCMSVIDFRNKSILYYDSMGSPNYKCLQALKQYLCEESVDKKKMQFNFEDWILDCVKDIPQQMNGSDCGVFSCVFAEYICANKTFNFSQDDMPYFRNKMVYEILTMQLL